MSSRRVGRLIAPTVVSAIVALTLFAGCNGKLAGAVTARQALEDATYDTQMKVYGTISMLGNVGVEGFLLSSDGRELMVYYGGMIEDNGGAWPSVDASWLKNGDRVVVTGELKSAGKYRTQNSFWSRSIAEY